MDDVPKFRRSKERVVLSKIQCCILLSQIYFCSSYCDWLAHDKIEDTKIAFCAVVILKVRLSKTFVEGFATSVSIFIFDSDESYCCALGSLRLTLRLLITSMRAWQPQWQSPSVTQMNHTTVLLVASDWGKFQCCDLSQLLWCLGKYTPLSVPQPDDSLTGKWKEWSSYIAWLHVSCY